MRYEDPDLNLIHAKKIHQFHHVIGHESLVTHGILDLVIRETKAKMSQECIPTPA